MFFPELIKSIKSGDRVLEVGPGASPFARADVYLEKDYEDTTEEFAQKAYNEYKTSSKKTVYYKGGTFPFKDGEFDYVVCSHVLEHIPAAELPEFINEMSRVASKGYIEFPNIFYELVNYQPVHLWLMNLRNKEILFLDKNNYSTCLVHEVFRTMVYGEDPYLYNAFSRYKEAFFCGFEWEGKIKYSIINNFDELVNNQDFNFIKKMFSFRPSRLRRLVVFLLSIKIKLSLFLNNKVINYKINHSRIHKTAVLENRALIKLGKRVEINEGVIIKTYDNPVVLGDNVQLNPFVVILGGSGVVVGKDVIIAPHCVIAAGNHDHRQVEQAMRFAPSVSRGPIVIEDDVWIGANSTIVDGVRIGRGAVVAANSVVNRDVEPYAVVGGVPARLIATRLKQDKTHV